MMNMGDKATMAAKTSASGENPFPGAETVAIKTSASGENPVLPGAGEGGDEGEYKVAAPDKEDVLTWRATVPTPGEVEAMMNGTGEKQKEVKGEPRKTSEGMKGVESTEAQATRVNAQAQAYRLQ